MMCPQGGNIQESPEEFHGGRSSREHRAGALDLPSCQESTIQAVYVVPNPILSARVFHQPKPKPRSRVQASTSQLYLYYTQSSTRPLLTPFHIS